MQEFIEAGKIASKAREYGKTLMKENAYIIDIANKVEEKIYNLNGQPSFPVDIGINHIAAHYSPVINDETQLKKGDIVKLDMGAAIEGYPTDTACTVEISSNNHTKLIEASEIALKKAIDKVAIGAKVSEIGRIIQDIITSYGFSPIKNLSGHTLDRYQVHAGLSIPNIDNGDKRQLEKSMVVAIEPFASKGIGRVMEGKLSGVYSLINKKPTRNMAARKVIKHIEDNYNTLPFSVRWLQKFPNYNFILRTLEKEGIIKQYNVLPEESKGLVSQAEHTILVDEEIKILTD